jgi:phage head maturation protease
MSLQSEFSDRLITLSDGRPGLRGGIHIDIREPSPADNSPLPSDGAGLSSDAAARPPSPSDRRLGTGEGSAASPLPSDGRGIKGEGNSSNPCLDFISSDETLDRYHEIIVPTGWDLSSYRRNPVFQNAHQYGDVIFTLGRSLLTEIRTVADRQVLYQRIEFATDINPIARIAYGLYHGKFLNAVSVGFIPMRWENGDGTGSPLPSDGRGIKGEGFLRRYLEQELLEVSAVAIPANPSALALAYKSGAIEKSDLRDSLDLLRALCPGDPGPSAMSATYPAPYPASSNPQQLLALARELRNLLAQ